MIPRYTRPEMARIWSDENRFRTWLAVEVAATATLAEAGIVPKEAAKAIRHVPAVLCERASDDIENAKKSKQALRRALTRRGIAGEIGLTGRLRQAAQAERRLEECAKLGIKHVITPAGTETLGKAIAAALV